MKHTLHNIFRRLKHQKPVKTWILVLVFVLAVAGGAWGLHQNNVNMIALRSSVLQADTSGGDVQKSLGVLSSYVFGHMNTAVTQLELVGTYNRDVAKIIQASKASQPNIYKQAQQACETDGEDSSGYATRIAQGAQDYVLAHLPSSQSDSQKFPDKSLYSYSFAAPVWSPDFAGLSIALAVVVGLWLLSRALIKLVAIILVRYRNR